MRNACGLLAAQTEARKRPAQYLHPAGVGVTWDIILGPAGRADMSWVVCLHNEQSRSIERDGPPCLGRNTGHDGTAGCISELHVWSG